MIQTPLRAGVVRRAFAVNCTAAFLMMLPLLPAAAQDATPEVTPDSTPDTLAVNTPEAVVTQESPAAEAIAPTIEPTQEATIAPESTPIVPAAGLFPEGALTAQGSAQLVPLVQAASDVVSGGVQISARGTGGGLAALCNGTTDLALSNRALTSDEEAACRTSGVAFTELLVGYDILTFAVDAASPITQCVTEAQINTIFAPSATGQITDWQQVIPEAPAQALTVIAPPLNAPGFLLLDNRVEGDAFRQDATLAAGADAITALAGDTGAVAAVPLTVAEEAGDSVRLLRVDGGTGCTAPSAENARNGSYPVAASLFVYANAASVAAKPALGQILGQLSSEAADPALLAAAFSLPTPDERAEGAQAVAEGRTGRTFSRAETTYAILPNVQGTVNVAGSASANALMEAVTTAFNAQYAAVTVTTDADGQVAGLRRLCNGEANLVFTHGELPADSAAACAANNIAVETYPLGRQTAVLVANAGTDFLQCLTTADLAAVWRASAYNTVTAWNAVNPQFPDAPITLFAPELGSPTNDVLMLTVTGSVDPLRDDAEFNADPLYRAAAVANVEGSLALMTWSEWETVSTSGQANVRLVQVDGGSGCVEPSAATIADGTYPLTRPLNLLVNRASLNLPDVQAVVWYLAQDEQLAQYNAAGLVGLTRDTLADRRGELETTFAEVALEATLAAEATPDPAISAEATADAQPTAETTAEVIGDIGTETVAEPTAEATAEATSAP